MVGTFCCRVLLLPFAESYHFQTLQECSKTKKKLRKLICIINKSLSTKNKVLTSFKNNDMKTLFCWLDIYYLRNYFQEIPVCRHKFKIILKKLDRCHFILTNFISYSFIVLRQDDVSIQK